SRYEVGCSFHIDPVLAQGVRAQGEVRSGSHHKLGRLEASLPCDCSRELMGCRSISACVQAAPLTSSRANPTINKTTTSRPRLNLDRRAKEFGPTHLFSCGDLIAALSVDS